MTLAWLIFFFLLLGALVFFAAGYLAAILRSTTKHSPLPSDESEHTPNSTPDLAAQQALEAQQSQAQLALDALQSKTKQAQIALEQSKTKQALEQQELDTLRSKQAQARQELDTLRSEQAQAQQELNALQSKQAQTQLALEQSKTKQAQALQELNAIQSKQAQAQQELETRRYQKEDDLSRLQQQTASLDKQHAGLLEQLTAEQKTNKALEEQLFGLRQYINGLSDETVPLRDFKKLEQIKNAREIETLQLQQRILELEEKAFQKKYLEQKLQDYDKIRNESEQMKKKIAELEAHLFFFHFREAQKTTAPSPKLHLHDGQPRDKIASIHIARWKAQKRYAAVVADRLGFPLIYEGKEDMEELMPICSALLQEIGEKVTEYLPLGKLTAIEVYTEQQHCLHSRFFDCNGELLALTFLEQQSHQPQEETDALLDQLRSLLSST